MKLTLGMGLIGALYLLLACPAFGQPAADYFARGEQDAQAGNWTKATLDYRSAVRQNPRNKDAWIGLAHAYNNKGKYKDAILAGREAVKLAPKNMLAHYNLGAAYYQNHDWTNAQRQFNAAHNLLPDSTEANIGVGLMYLHSSQIPEAIKAFKTALKSSPDSAVSHLGLGMAYAVAGDGKNAKNESDVLEALALTDPSVTPMAMQLKEEMARRFKSDAAVVVASTKADAATKAAGRWPIGLSYLAGVLPIAVLSAWFLYSRNRINSEPVVNARIEIKDPNMLAGNSLTPIVVAPVPRTARPAQEGLPASLPPAGGAGGFTLPRTRTEPPTLLDTPSHIATSNSQLRAGSLNFKAGKYQEALEAYRDALRLNPNSMEAFNGLGQCYARQEVWDDAADAFRQALRINPENAGVHYNLGEAYLALEQHQNAMEAFKQAIRLAPNDPKAHYQYGMTSILLNDKSTALDEFKILKKMSSEMANKLFNAIYPS